MTAPEGPTMKVTGYLRVDRPQQTSSQPPTLAEHARQVIRAALEDYAEEFGE
jgi:hypothetical protein